MTTEKHIRFEPWGYSPSKKTKLYGVFTLDVKPLKLGEIKWYGQWRKYCFFPSHETVFDSTCLEEVKVFLTNLMLLRNQERKKPLKK